MTSEADDIYGQARRGGAGNINKPWAQDMSGGIHIGFIQRLMEQATTSKYVKQLFQVFLSSFKGRLQKIKTSYLVTLSY